MLIIIHRINTVQALSTVPSQYGVEIDVRGYGTEILLNHDPIDQPEKYESLDNFLRNYHHKFIVFNMKEAGYEQRVIDLAASYGINDYFLLDVEFPYLYAATRKHHFRKIAVRYSEAEPIEAVLAQKENGQPLVDWVWVDTNTRLPLNREVMNQLTGFKTCLVCPERWGRPQDVSNYQLKMKTDGIEIDAVMTSLKYAGDWDRFPSMSS